MWEVIGAHFNTVCVCVCVCVCVLIQKRSLQVHHYRNHYVQLLVVDTKLRAENSISCLFVFVVVQQS